MTSGAISNRRKSRTKEPLTFYYQNVRGLNTKTIQFSIAVAAQSHDVIALSETWLSESVLDAELFDGRYLVFRRDRGSRGGGVLLAVRKQKVKSARPLHRLNTNDAEH